MPYDTLLSYFSQLDFSIPQLKILWLSKFFIIVIRVKILLKLLLNPEDLPLTIF